MPARACRFPPEVVGSWGKILRRGVARSDGRYFSPALHGEWLEASDTGGGNPVLGQVREGQARGAGKQQQDWGVQDKG